MTDDASPDRGDVEALADAILDAVERDADTRLDADALPDVFSTAAMAFRRLPIDFVRRYNRLEVDTDTHACPRGDRHAACTHGFDRGPQTAARVGRDTVTRNGGGHMPKAQSKPRRRRVDGEASQQRILEAATEIAAERGYEGTSINLVSERSGLPASSIYWHFKDKDALIAAVIDHSFQSWLAKAGTAETDRDAGGPVEEQLSAMMQSTAEALKESSDFLRLGLMLTLERREQEPTARRRFLDVRKEALDRTTASFGRLFPGLDNTGLRRLSTFTMAVADGLFIANEINDDGPDALAGFELLAAAIHGAAHHLLEGSAGRR